MLQIRDGGLPIHWVLRSTAAARPDCILCPPDQLTGIVTPLLALDETAPPARAIISVGRAWLLSTERPIRPASLFGNGLHLTAVERRSGYATRRPRRSTLKSQSTVIR
jgi:hypothetical protein